MGGRMGGVGVGGIGELIGAAVTPSSVGVASSGGLGVRSGSEQAKEAISNKQTARATLKHPNLTLPLRFHLISSILINSFILVKTIIQEKPTQFALYTIDEALKVRHLSFLIKKKPQISVFTLRS